MKIYDDFAHHPTAITYASEAIRNEFKENKILGIIELGSNTMSSGSHGNAIFDSVTAFDEVIWLDHNKIIKDDKSCLLYTSPSPRDISGSRMPSSA